MRAQSPYDEMEILAGVSKGDEKAFEILYNEYQPRLLLYLLPFTCNSREEAEEVIQDTFLKVWRRREGLLEIKNFPSYLFRMARNRFLDGLQKKKNYTNAINKAGFREDTIRSLLEEDIMLAEYRATAREAIDQLSPQRKKIFTMRCEQEMSFDDIAESLQIARTTVKNQYYEAVHSVKAFLRQNGDVILLLLLFLHVPR